MLIKVVGIQSQDFTLDNGYHFSGKKYHAIDMETSVPGQDGNQVMTFKIPSDHKLAAVPVEVGKTYHMYCDQKGRPDFIQEYKT